MNTDTDIKIRIIFNMQNTGTRIYILYIYELYKLTTKIFVHKYILVFFSRKIFFIVVSKGLVPYFYNHTKNLYNKFEFLKK